MHFFAQNRKIIILSATASVLFFSGFLLFHNLSAEPFQDYDEATYAEVTSESLVRGNYLSLTFLNQPYFRKPPLLFWLGAAAESFFEDAEFAMRLPSALAAFLLIPLVALICIEAGAGLGTALLATVILATTSAAMEPARQVRFDVLISFFITAAFYAGMRAGRIRWWYLVMGASIAFAVLTKSVIAVFAPVALLIYLLQREQLRFLRDPWFWGGVGAFLLIAAPWHIYETLRFGSAFWDSYLGSQVLDRLNSNLFEGISSSMTTNADYIRFFFTFAAPWAQLFCASVIASPFVYKKLTPKARAVFVTCVGTVFAIFGVMLLSHTKAVTYLIPIYPFMAVAISLSARAIWDTNKSYIRAGLLGLLFTIIPTAAYSTVQNVFHLNPYYSKQYALAVEEYEITQIINERNLNPLIYTYKSDTLGSVQYYTHLPFTKYPFIYRMEDATSTTSNAYVLTTVSVQELQEQFPHFSFEPLFVGSMLSLFAFDS